MTARHGIYVVNALSALVFSVGTAAFVGCLAWHVLHKAGLIA